MFFKRPVLTLLGLGLGLGWLAGCLPLEPRPTTVGPNGQKAPASPLSQQEPTPQLKTSQIADVQFSLAVTLEKEGKIPQAVAGYQKALETDPARADVAAHLAVLLDRQAEFALSETYHQKALAAAPAQADYLCNYGYSLYLQKRLAEAEKHLRQALDANPRNRRARNNLGLVLAHLGREGEALVEFQNASGSKADAHGNLAFALALQKDWEGARDQYQYALHDNPTSPQARQGLQKVNQLSARAPSSPALLAPPH